ncbi:MAG: cytochrome c biogenesis protein CcsA [Betaproteobacteria bacterium]|nr:cytochrome c biogenesis protein CcsA [Betaproteobacteria bacterium]MBI2958743.1 cytochrome c biogenesis protein CcsA [Betaproteobacteria bacterium]
MDAIVLYVAVAAAYALLAFHFWRTRWSGAKPAAIAPWERAAILAPLALHAWLLYEGLFAASEFRFGFGYALSCMLWLAALIYWVESLFYPLEGMQPLVLGLAAACAPLPALFPGMPSPPYAQSFQFRIHTVIAMAAYSLFTIAALHAMLMTLVERRLHHAKLSGHVSGPLAGPLAVLPPLLTLESLLFRIIALGFVLLTLTLATGIISSETAFGRAMPFSHKTVFAILSWIIFGALLAGRRLRGWRGRTALRWTLAGFVVLLLAYVGTHFVLEVILRRGQV